MSPAQTVKIFAAVALVALAGVTASAASASSGLPAPPSPIPTLPVQNVTAPETKFSVQAPELRELSGMSESDDGRMFYGIQDAGNTPDLFVLGDKGNLLGAIRLPFPNQDWEDVALQRRPGKPGLLYVSDTGDASVPRRAAGEKPRTTFDILRIDEPVLSDPATLHTPGHPARFPVTFADGGKHNVETILVQPGTGRVYLVDKKAGAGQPAGVWEGPATLSTKGKNVFTEVAELAVLGISSGSFSATGRVVALRDADTVFLWPWDAAGMAATIAVKPHVLAVRDQPQGESLTFTPDGRSVLLGSEGQRYPVLSLSLDPSLQDPLAGTAGPVTRTGGRIGRPLLLGSGGVALVVLVIVAVLLLRRRYRVDLSQDSAWYQG